MVTPAPREEPTRALQAGLRVLVSKRAVMMAASGAVIGVMARVKVELPPVPGRVAISTDSQETEGRTSYRHGGRSRSGTRHGRRSSVTEAAKTNVMPEKSPAGTEKVASKEQLALPARMVLTWQTEWPARGPN